MPSEDGVGHDDCVSLTLQHSAQSLVLDLQPPLLVVIQQDSFTRKLLPQDATLFLEAFDGLLLLVEPTCKQRGKDHEGKVHTGRLRASWSGPG